VPLNHLLTDRQTNARSGILCPAMQALEDLEDALGELGLNPNAVILKGEEPIIPPFHCGDMYLWRLIAVVFNAVADQILKDRNKL